MKISGVPILGKKQNIFGTDGIRGKVGIEPFTVESIIKLGNAIGAWAKDRYPHPVILLGDDYRESCSFVKAALQTGLLLYDITMYDGYTVPTPAIFRHMAHMPMFTIGIIISASHNPYYDNGIKIVDSYGKLSLEDELAISQLFFEPHEKNSYNSFGLTRPYVQLIDDYRNTFSSYFAKQFLSGKKIILDLANGATSCIAQKIFEDFHANVITINNIPDGRNINHQCGALDLSSLQSAMMKHKADAGFAFDGDGDRVIAVNRHGQIKDGDDLLTLLVQHPLYQDQKKIVGTVMSNHGLEVHLKKMGKQLDRVHVGDKYIAQKLEVENLRIGGEQSGHIILRDYLNTGDGIFTALRVMESIVQTNNWDMNTFEKFPQVLINTPISIKKDLTSPSMAQLIEEYESQLINGRLLVRYSGTESIIRVMVEDVHFEHAQTIAKNLSHELAKVLQ